MSILDNYYGEGKSIREKINELEEENKKLKDRVEELEKERSRDGLLGQATMEEAYNRIIELEEENKKLEEDVERLIKLSGHKTTTIMGLGKNLDEVKEENKMLKKEIENHKQNIMQDELEIIPKLEEENKKLKEEVKELNETLEHRDSVLSIMYDLLRSDLSDYEQLCMIDVEVGNEPQNKLREELLDRFWKRDF